MRMAVAFFLSIFVFAGSVNANWLEEMYNSAKNKVFGVKAPKEDRATVCEQTPPVPAPVEETWYMGDTVFLDKSMFPVDVVKRCADCQCGSEMMSVRKFSKYNDVNPTEQLPAETWIYIPTCSELDALQVKALNATPVLSSTKKGPFKWVVVGGDPFNNRDYVRGFRKAGVSEEVIEKLKILVDNRDYITWNFRNGDRAEWMLFGEYNVVGVGNKYKGFEYDGVVAAFRDMVLLPGQIYCVEDNGVLRRFFRPDICFNWCELPPVSIPPKVENPPVWEPPVAEPTPIPDSVPEEPPFPPAPPAPDIPDMGPKVFLRLDVWLSHDMPTYGMFTRYGANSYGTKGDILWKVNRHLMLGATATIAGWDGESRTGFFYNGFQACAGPLGLISFNNYVHWGLDVTSGGEWDWGWGTKDWKYRSFQSGVPLRLGTTLDIVGKKLHFSSWGGYKFSFAEAKESSINGEVLDSRDDQPIDKVGADGGARLYFLVDKKVNPLIVWRESWSKFDECLSTTAGLGIRFWDRHAVFEISYKNRDRSIYAETNGHAIEALLNLSWGFGRGRPKINVEDQTKTANTNSSWFDEEDPYADTKSSTTGGSHAEDDTW